MPAILHSAGRADLWLCYSPKRENDAMRKALKPTACSVALVFVLGLTLAVQAQSQGNNSAEAVSLNNSGLQLLQKGKVDEAIALYRQALQIGPDFPEALDNLGLA